jgi:carboxylesterase type B
MIDWKKDTRRIAADSVKDGKPIIVVALNYRLNIFGFGDGTETNLALKDQMLGVEWVREYIEGFGGDKVFHNSVQV